MSLLKTNEIQNYNGSSLTLTASTVSTSAQLNTGGNISVTGSLNVSDDSTTRTNLGLGTIATQDSDSITVTGGTATLGALTVSGSDSGDLVRITQTGSGNALVVEDSANPDNTSFVVDSSGRVLIGANTSYQSVFNQTFLQIHNVAGSSSASVFRYSNDGFSTDIDFCKSRGATTGTHSIVSNGDILTTLRFTGSDGTNFIRAAQIVAEVDGTPGTNDMPGRLVFSTTADGASSPTERMWIDSSGNVGIGASPSDNLNVSSTNPTFRLSDTNNVSYSRIIWDGNLSTLYIEADRGNQIANSRISFTLDGSEKIRIDSGGNFNISNLSASSDVQTDASKNLITTSDARLKNEIGLIDESGIEVIKQIIPKYFSWKNDENNTQQLGFFAQDIYPVLPEAAPRALKYTEVGRDENDEPILEQVFDEDGNPDYEWGFTDRPIIAMLVKAIQEQQVLIESQQSQIDALTARIVDLETT